MTLSAIKGRWAKFAQTEAKRKLARLLRVVFYTAIFLYLAHQLSKIGWNDLWQNLPDETLYFAILPLLYATLPVAEALIYGRIWGIRKRDAMLAAVKKRALNTDVVSYSGEVQFYLWAKRKVDLEPSQVLRSIKDNLIISSAASLLSALFMLVAFIATGQIEPFDVAGGLNLWHVAGVAGIIAIAAAALLRFRQQVFYLPSRTLAGMLFVHVSRFIVGWTLLIMQWQAVVPSVPFETWALLLTAIVLVDRIPLLPSKDLVFAGVGIQMASMLQVSPAVIAGMFLVRSAFDKSMNLGLFAFSSLSPSRKTLQRVPAPAELRAEPARDEAELPLAPAA